MKQLIALIIAIVTLVFIPSCGYNEGVRTSEPVSYLYFTGENARGSIVKLSDGTSFTVTATGLKNRYKVAPGKQRITITKGGKTLVTREVLLGDGQEKELSVPSL